MQCNSCGTELPEGAVNYCPRCGAAIIHQVVPEPERTSYGTSGPTIAPSSNAGEQHYPSTSYGSAPSAVMSWEQHASGSPYRTPLQVPPAAAPPQNMTAPLPVLLPPDMAPPLPLSQPGGPPNGKRGFAISRGKILLLIGLVALIVVGSVSILLYASRGTINQEKAAATIQTNATTTAQSSVAYQSVQGTVRNWIEDLTEQNGGSTDNPRTLILLEGSPTLYLFHAKDFNGVAPDPLNGDYGVGSQVTIVYRPDKTFTIDETGPGVPPTYWQGTAYQVVQFTVFDSNGQNPKVFTTKE